ncbi:HipA family kinase [Pseudomonas quasicaspiana]|uniref:HipA family kinase n=1 Tax=Pseudomonas quasicaspiana TaxID=2829821 RepID=UPI001E31A9F4|nr:HipA family kinase [Pseudomonas quasicaspiana]MCD5970746.1 hypothetical protein [Pseudomonas quasicaspiana]
MSDLVTAVEIVRQSHQGISIKPFIIRADDGETYFVKGLSKSGGPALISELLSAELGKFLGLPIPPWKKMVVPQDLIEFSLIPNVSDLEGGLAFASQSVENAIDFNIAHLKATPRDLMRRVLLFDWWIQNGDRILGPLGGNVNLILDGRGELSVIDHNMAFHKSFNPDEFLAEHVFCECREDFRDYLVRQEYTDILSKALSNWDRMITFLTEDWLYRDADLIDLTEPTLASRLEILQMFKDERFWGAL